MTRSAADRLLIVFAITLLVGGSSPLVAQKPVTQGAVVTETFVIDAIDHGARLVTLRDPEGQTETIYCGPGVERFDALKVGDKVTFRYHESLVYQIRKPGSAVSAPSVSSEMVRTPGDRPGGTISDQIKTTVTVNAVDVKVPSITVTTAEGKKMSFKVENAKNLEGIVPGDKVEITYTVALAISVTSPGR